MSFISSFTVLALLFLGTQARAVDGLFTGIHHHYQSARALGMGDAYVAVANDYGMMFYNPAGLGRLEESQMNLSMDFGLSTSYLAFEKDVKDAGTGGTESEQQQRLITLLQKNYGNLYSARFGLFQGIWLSPNWGIAVLPADMTIEYTVQDQGVPSINTRVYLDSTVALAYGSELRTLDAAGRVYWGVTGKFINRGYYSKQVNVLDLSADPDALRPEDLRDGYTVDADVGVLYIPYLPTEGLLSYLRYTKPTFGAVVKNVGDYGFGQSLNIFKRGTKGDAPEKLHRVLDIGTKWEYPSVWIFGGRGVMDFRDIGHPNYSFNKGLHLGFEFDWTVSSWWKGQYRFGMNQGFLTLGASALFTLFRLDLVSYGEDVGYFGKPKENRVYALKMNVDW